MCVCGMVKAFAVSCLMWLHLAFGIYELFTVQQQLSPSLFWPSLTLLVAGGVAVANLAIVLVVGPALSLRLELLLATIMRTTNADSVARNKTKKHKKIGDLTNSEIRLVEREKRQGKYKGKGKEMGSKAVWQPGQQL